MCARTTRETKHQVRILDRSGRLITASSADYTRSFSPEMVIPIFYNPERPERDQVALCGSVYEVDEVH